ncbi:MAG: hypothetical protein PUH25_09280, partial [Spirochaetales bacterium]|nr:hypothetical protein [Spirochaetales bacterium]
FDKIEDIKSKYSSSGLMGKAINYALEYKPYTSLYLDYVEGAPDNNCCLCAVLENARVFKHSLQHKELETLAS